MSKKACIFDLDGTLADTVLDIANCMNEAIKKYGVSPHPKDSYRYFMGNGVLDMIIAALPEQLRNDETVLDVHKIYSDLYRQHYLDFTKPFEGIIELLTKLSDMNIKLAVLSNKSHDFTVNMVLTLFKDFKFEVIHGKKDEIPLKPDPESALCIAREMNVLPHECIFIGDSDVDMQTAKNAGMFGAGAGWGFRGSEELIENGADVILNNPSDLLLLF